MPKKKSFIKKVYGKYKERQEELKKTLPERREQKLKDLRYQLEKERLKKELKKERGPSGFDRFMKSMQDNREKAIKTKRGSSGKGMGSAGFELDKFLTGGGDYGATYGKKKKKAKKMNNKEFDKIITGDW